MCWCDDSGEWTTAQYWKYIEQRDKEYAAEQKRQEERYEDLKERYGYKAAVRLTGRRR